MKKVLGAACALGLLVVGCDDDTTTGGGAGRTESVGTDGGEFSVDGAGVSISPGALSEDTEITVAEVTGVADPPAGYALAGPAIAFTPHGQSFDEDIRITLPYESSSDDLVIVRLDDESDESWEVVEGGEFEGGEASVIVRSFSIYGVAEEAGEDSGGEGDDEDAGGGSSGGSNSGGNGGSGGEAADCTTLCETETALGCDNAVSQAECEAECETQSAMFAEGVCGIDAVAFGECVTSMLDTAYECDEDGEPGVKDGVCADEFDALITCATTGVNSAGEMAMSDGSVQFSCVEMDDSTNTCIDYIGSTYVSLPPDAVCGGEGQTPSEDACDPAGAFAKCHVDEGGPSDQVIYFFSVDEGNDASRQAFCEQGLQGVFSEL